MKINSLQKHLEWQENRDPIKKHRCVARPTMFLASLDIKTACDDAKPKHVANVRTSRMADIECFEGDRAPRKCNVRAS